MTRWFFGLALLLSAPAYAQQSSQPVVEISNSAILSTAVTVTSSSTTLPSSALTGRRRMLLQNRDSAISMFVGSCSGTVVTSSNGFEVLAGAALIMELGPGVSICGITASGSINVRVLEFR